MLAAVLNNQAVVNGARKPWASFRREGRRAILLPWLAVLLGGLR